MRRIPLASSCLIALALLLAGCGGSADTDPGPAAASASSVATTAPSTPPEASPQASTAPSTAPSSEAGTFTRDGVTLDLPTGWKAAGLEPRERQQAIAEASEPALKQFLTQRLDGAAQTGGIMYLYDPRSIGQGEVSTVEVYGYPDRASVQEVVDAVVVPRLSGAGLSPKVEPTTLPAGKATQVATSTDAPSGLAVRNKVVVLMLGDRVVGVSGTDTGKVSPELDEVLASVRAG